ncbi:MAG: hypothetical protein QOD05_892 [Microbacteriaceae bacterium]|jgi:hypothetical protein|nr:hypothetical protein [Microbacteriaceae bacterium]
MKTVVLFVVTLVVVAMVGGGVFAFHMLSGVFPGTGVQAAPPPPPCPTVAPTAVGTISVPAGPVAGFCQDRLINAAYIINAARVLGLGAQAEEIGVMTAIGESHLQVLNYGDAAGVDSRGLFQQRDNGAWGTLADRMDPTISATNFFKKLVSINGWAAMSPSLAAHQVQVNADPNYYDAYWSEAQTIVARLGG